MQAHLELDISDVDRLIQEGLARHFPGVVVTGYRVLSWNKPVLTVADGVAETPDFRHRLDPGRTRLWARRRPEADEASDASDLAEGHLVRVWEVQHARRWPGDHSPRDVKVTDGRVLAVLEPGALPTEAQVAKGWFRPKSRASKYRRVVVQALTGPETGWKLRRAETITLGRGTRLARLSEAESLR